MDKTTLWRLKLLQILHDPPGKPMAQWYRGNGGRGHAALGRDLLQAFGGLSGRSPAGPDRLMSAADRPNTGPAHMCRVQGWHKEPLLSHPLAAHALRFGTTGLDPDKDEHDPLAAASFEVSEAHEEQLEALKDLADRLLGPLGDDSQRLRQAWTLLWRALPDQLAGLRGHLGKMGDAQRLWTWIPADTRCPDVSIWDHTRLASAVAWFDRTRNVADRAKDGPDAPWMLSVKVGPVSDFIDQARTSRDLWLGSYLLAELSWAAMQPVIERYGPDAILYPDLRRNPRADRWLADAPDLPDVLPEDADPRTRASVIPNHWVAVVPKGFDGDLLAVQELGEQCAQAVQDRWDELAGRVWAGIAKALTDSGLGTDVDLKAAWTLQHRRVLATTWLAAPWAWMDGQPEVVGRALIAQGPAGSVPADSAPPDPRRARFEPLVGTHQWLASERSRWTSLAHWPHYGDARGWDYPLHHLRLVRLHDARSKARPASLPFNLPPGEVCTVCRMRPVLWLDKDGSGNMEARRKRMRDAWKKLGEHDAIHEPRFGEERLCAICLFRRLLVRSGRPQEPADLNRLWTGNNPEWALDRKTGLLRFPFPSTATLAAQAWLRGVLPDPRLQGALRAVVDAARNASWPQTAFAAALPALRHLAATCPDPMLAEELLKYDAQLFFPDTLQATVEREGNKETGNELVRRIRTLRGECRRLTEQDRAKDLPGPGLPDPRFAILRMDGDAMGRLLTGDEQRIKVRWRDVLHPLAVEQLESGRGRKDGKVPWRSLLDTPRGMGPSLHAAISRMLVDFAHRVVPWVVEQEFAGRLVYTGGDDVLALLPAADALPAARRLQELFSAAWVLDGRPDLAFGEPFSAANPEAWDPDRARSRFAILSKSGERVDLGRGELFALLGPNQSLSGGIAVAHFKTPLGGVLRKAGDMLQVAKDLPGHAPEVPDKAAVGVAAYSRGGVKVQAAVKWGQAGHLERAIEGFAQGTLPGKLPYQLREPARALLAIAATGAEVDGLSSALLSAAGAGEWKDGPYKTQVEALWANGVTQACHRLTAKGHHVDDPTVELATAPLRLARTLASTEEGED